MPKYTLRSRKKNQYRVAYEQELNEEQLEVVMAPGGPMLVIAGAGSGKTRTLTYRVARLIEDGVSPANILLLTFTNKAAREMLRRVEALTQLHSTKLWGGTFHHIGNTILRRHAKKIGRNPNFSILDKEDAKDLMETAVTELFGGKAPTRIPKGEVLEDIHSFCLNTQASLAEVLKDRYPAFIHIQKDLERIFQRYEEKKQENNMMDFDDLLVYWLTLLQQHPPIRRYYQQRFRHILVDEYQDTNRLQGDIISLMADQNGNIMVVGDDAQSIYAFRGACIDNILNFPKRFPNARIYYLSKNYRSTPEILSFANASISHNTWQYPKDLSPVRDSLHQPVQVVPCQNVYQQAQFVVSKILDLRDEGMELSQIGVLYRAHYQSMELQMELQKEGIPFQVRSGLRFFEQRHVKDVLAFIKLWVNPKDEIAWKRALLLFPGIGRGTFLKLWNQLSASANPLEKLQEKQVEALIPKRGKEGFLRFKKLMKNLPSTPASAIRYVVDRFYKEYALLTFPNAYNRLDELEALAEYALSYENHYAFLEQLALLSELGGEDVMAEPDKSVDVLTLSTIHQAKGLEWDVVIIIGLADGQFPSHRSMHALKDLEEERRLFYVACTRSRNELYLCYPLTGYRGRDREALLTPSRFLQEIPVDLFEVLTLEDEDYLF